MSAEIVPFPGPSRLNLPADRILSAAIDANLSEAIVIGRDKNGDEVFMSSVADGGDVLWLLERMKLRLMTGCHND